MEKIKYFAGKAVTAIIILSVIALMIYSAMLYKSKAALEEQIEQSRSKLDKITLELKEARHDGQLWHDKFTQISATAQSDSEALKSNIEAFAKQAAACDTLRKKLHVTE